MRLSRMGNMVSSQLNRRQFQRLLALSTIAWCTVGNDCWANATPVLRPGDEVWEVSSRCLPDLRCGEMLHPVSFRVSKFDCSGWTQSNDQELAASFDTNPGLRTVLYVHGNWMEMTNARGRGGYVYNRTSQSADEPIRFIMYSWPSQRDGGPLRDVYEKADRSDMDTYYFAELLSRIPAVTPLGVYAFSFGGRVAAGGLHMVSGGRFEGRTASVWSGQRMVRVSFLAPAFDNTWLAANRPYSMALNNVDSLVNVYNSRDPVLRRFRFIDRVTAPIAAGFSGLADPRATQPLQADKKIRQYDCGNDVGNSHDEMNYYHKCCSFRHALNNLLGK